MSLQEAILPNAHSVRRRPKEPRYLGQCQALLDQQYPVRSAPLPWVRVGLRQMVQLFPTLFGSTNLLFNQGALLAGGLPAFPFTSSYTTLPAWRVPPL